MCLGAASETKTWLAELQTAAEVAMPEVWVPHECEMFYDMHSPYAYATQVGRRTLQRYLLEVNRRWGL